MISLSDPRFPFVFGGGVSFLLVAGGVLLAEILGLAACPLCIWQRMLYMLFSLLALLACAGPEPSRFLLALLMACTASGGMGVAGYQVWIQRFAPATTCGGKEPWWEAFVNWAGNHVPLLFKASGLCSDPAWKFFELSIADWSLLAFAFLFVLSVYALGQSRRGILPK